MSDIIKISKGAKIKVQTSVSKRRVNLADANTITEQMIRDSAVTAAKLSITTMTYQAFLSGSGTYTTPAGTKYLRVRMVGGGGGGAGGGPGATNGTAGGNTTFGSSLLTVNGGALGKVGNDVGGLGGTCTINSPATGFSFVGGKGGGGSDHSGNGGDGGSTPFGGCGTNGPSGSTPGVPGITNTGSGGAGGSAASGGGANSGSGGGGGGYIEAFIASPSATYAYAIGVGGNAGGTGTPGGAGGAGGSGIIVVEEYYV